MGWPKGKKRSPEFRKRLSLAKQGGGMKTEFDFWARLDRSNGPDSCWPWMKGTDQKGYGQTCWRGVYYKAHRLAFIFCYGPITCGRWVLHHCDNPPCCNPKHLYLGTVQDNVRDMMERGRYRAAQIGEKNPASKLTEADVRKIRASELSNGKAAKQFGVSRETIRNIRNYRKWAHVA